VLAQICADGLGTGLDRIRVIHGQTDRIARGMGAFALRLARHGDDQRGGDDRRCKAGTSLCWADFRNWNLISPGDLWGLGANPDRHFHQTVAKAFDKEFGPL